MGNRKFYDQIIADMCQHEKDRITDEIDVTTMKDYMQVHWGGVMWSVRMKTVMQELDSKIMQMYNLNIVMCTMLDKKTLIVIDV